MTSTGTGTLGRLSLIGRLLLTTDGTVMPLLEHIVGERVVTAGLDQSTAPVSPDDAGLLAVGGGPLVTRTTMLVGATTSTVYVNARSVLAAGAMPAPLRSDLMRTAVPIGTLIRKHRVESFREILSVRIPENADPLEPSRRYRVFIGGIPVLLIEESFAADCFRSAGV